MTSTWVIPSSQVVHISEKIEFYKAETQYYPLYTLSYIMVMQDAGSNQEKQKLL